MCHIGTVGLVVMVMVIENTTSPSFSPVVPALVSSSLLSFSSFLSDWRSSGVLNILGEEGVEEREGEKGEGGERG